ncbi:MAG: cytochrome b/b6 domain-containing protein [Pseudomonadota bacterium]|nr:cytochrome b/b6 domain-containing protein [Pseudomonadota bacterium]MDP1903005.1 cytochrome b/b6 domain-containing protein [Pseudomonadota bacterium]MDP2352223.1 cytochrome b/b6 domain-containing protein [Pseudomonadota bacterium]
MTRLLLDREKVYDPVLRSLHAWNALAIVLLLLGGRIGEWLGYAPEAAGLWRLHVWAGYCLVFGLVARLTWGMVGPAHARVGALWQPRAWWRALRYRALFAEPQGWGHDAPATLGYLLLYLLLFGMAVTGLALAAIEQGRGPLYLWLGHDVTLSQLFRVPHEWMEPAILVLLVAHIAVLILRETRHGIPTAQAMVSGFQYRKKPDAEAE